MNFNSSTFHTLRRFAIFGNFMNLLKLFKCKCNGNSIKNTQKNSIINNWTIKKIRSFLNLEYMAGVLFRIPHRYFPCCCCTPHKYHDNQQKIVNKNVNALRYVLTNTTVFFYFLSLSFIFYSARNAFCN